MNPKVVSTITTIIALLGLSFGSLQVIPLPPTNDTIHRPANADSGSDLNFGIISSEEDPLAWETTTRIMSDLPDPSQRNQEFTVSVRVSSNYGTPPGWVSVSTRGSACTIQLQGGRGSCSIRLARAGDYTITARYLSYPLGYFMSSSDTEPHRVSKSETTTSILSDLPDPSQAGQPFTISFTVDSDLGVPTGSVTVSESTGGTSCTGLLESGAGSCSMALASAGTYILRAAYAGNDDYLSSMDTEGHNVAKAETATIILSDQPDPSLPGQLFTVTYHVTSEFTLPTGTVTVTVLAAGASCSSALEAGNGSCSLLLAEPGEYVLTTTFSGDDNHLGSQAEDSHTVTLINIYLPVIDK